MARTAILAIRIISDARKAAKDLQGFESGAGKMQSRLEKVTPAAKAVAVGVAAIGAASFKQASDLQQSSGAVESVFGKQAAAVKAYGKAAAGNVGLAQSEYQQLASVLGSQLGNLGVSQDKLVGVTDALIRKGADLSAMFGGTSKEAVEALSAAMRGETDPIERYGISIKQANVQALLAERGQTKLTGAAATAAKTQATLDLITQQSAKSHGQFAREADTASGAQQRAEAAAKNAGAALGQVLLPVVAALAMKAAEAATFVQDNAKAFTILGGVLAAVAGIVLTVNAALSAYKAIATAIRVATIVWRNAQLALNLALMANPVGLVVLAVVALVAIIVVAYKKSETFRNIVQGAFHAMQVAASAVVGWVKKNWPLLLAILTGPFGLAVLAIVKHWDKIKAGGQAVLDKVKSIAGWIRDNLVRGFNTFKDAGVRAFHAIISPIQKAIAWVERLLDKIANVHIPSISDFGGSIFGGGGIFGFAGTSTAKSSPTLYGAQGLMGTASLAGSSGSSSAAGGGSGRVVQVVIQGAIDPVSTARQVRKLLSQDARRFGVVTNG